MIKYRLNIKLQNYSPPPLGKFLYTVLNTVLLFSYTCLSPGFKLLCGTLNVELYICMLLLLLLFLFFLLARKRPRPLSQSHPEIGTLRECFGPGTISLTNLSQPLRCHLQSRLPVEGNQKMPRLPHDISLPNKIPFLKLLASNFIF